MVGNQYDISMTDIFDNEHAPYEILETHDTIDDIKKFIKDSIERIIEILCISSSNSTYNSAVKESIKYIHSNYMKDISLSIIADYVNISPTYLSFLFKQETGNNFVDYLKEYRIKKAIELMETTNRKISEIAQSVGISNRKYFSKLFKEKLGVSPAEYKKQ
jgi:two-component system response regulator YesN